MRCFSAWRQSNKGEGRGENRGLWRRPATPSCCSPSPSPPPMDGRGVGRPWSCWAVSLLQFEETLDAPDLKDGLRKLIDPKLGDDYPIDAILKVRKTYSDRAIPPHVSWFPWVVRLDMCQDKTYVADDAPDRTIISLLLSRSKLFFYIMPVIRGKEPHISH